MQPTNPSETPVNQTLLNVAIIAALLGILAALVVPGFIEKWSTKTSASKQSDQVEPVEECDVHLAYMEFSNGHARALDMMLLCGYLDDPLDESIDTGAKMGCRGIPDLKEKRNTPIMTCEEVEFATQILNFWVDANFGHVVEVCAEQPNCIGPAQLLTAHNGELLIWRK
ncbi:hypothetical protein HN358_03110 [Candidatus Uhrbacteria bacterium]|jgi:hypothetical protein|nr:hypothetical protein [Candidatus Uhrbacteria bacterium]MBT7717190.1 hypothetical protein [Candidatus Uhrbacteria bacterium]